MNRPHTAIWAVLGTCLSVVLATGCGASSQRTTSSPGRTSASGTEHVKPCPGSISAHKIPGDSSPFPSAVIGPVRNAWVAGGTTVFAGGKGSGHPNTGKFLIIRNGMGPRTHSIYVERAGVLKITKAPLGCKVVRWAQEHGNLQFTSSNGVGGTLHLRDDTVTLSP